ncbi:hypothetical protein LINPERHAP1_LOCUS30370, partial [Linum perenne]
RLLPSSRFRHRPRLPKLLLSLLVPSLTRRPPVNVRQFLQPVQTVAQPHPGSGPPDPQIELHPGLPRGGGSEQVRISDGEKLVAAANLGFTNSFTKDRILKMGSLGSQSPSPSPSTSPPMNPFWSVSNSFSEGVETPNQGMLKSKSASHVVIGGVTCPMVRKLSLLKHRSNSLNGKVQSIKS